MFRLLFDRWQWLLAFLILVLLVLMANRYHVWQASEAAKPPCKMRFAGLCIEREPAPIPMDW